MNLTETVQRAWSREPIRVANLALLIISGAVAPAILAWTTGADLRASIGAGVAAWLVLFPVSEMVRAKTDSPETKAAKEEAVRELEAAKVQALATQADALIVSASNPASTNVTIQTTPDLADLAFPDPQPGDDPGDGDAPASEG